jgi:uncharacterized protein (TIGR03435 family)
MEAPSNKIENFRKPRMRIAAILAAAGLILTGMIAAPTSHAQSGAQNSSAVAPIFEYEVSTVKLYKPGAEEANGGQRMGMMNAPDGFSASGVTLQILLQYAYNVLNNQISSGPDWLNSERFQIDAKMDGAVADALQKLSQDERTEARRKMLQKLLADRFNLTIRKDTRELPVFNLVIAKNGSKLHEVQAPSIPPPGTNPGRGGGRGGPGTISIGGRGAVQTLNAQAVQIPTLIRMLSGSVGRPVLDKTGLTGFYDINLQWLPEQAQGAAFAAPDGGPPRGDSPAPLSDSSAPSIFVAVQEQLGLKLESAKGPIDLIVVVHAEKPSDN